MSSKSPLRARLHELVEGESEDAAPPDYVYRKM